MLAAVKKKENKNVFRLMFIFLCSILTTIDSEVQCRCRTMTNGYCVAMPTPPRRTPLSSALAQRVVDLVAPLINHNINVFDEHGTVIAAVDRSRIGTLHHGAQRAVEEEGTVLITAPDPSSQDRPGANEPLVIDGALCGVVGVTGDPHLVAPLARLVALTVSLLVTQEREHDSLTRRHTEARDLIAALTSGTTPEKEALERLQAAGIQPPWRLGLWADVEPGRDGSAQPPSDAEAIAVRINAEDRRLAAVLHGALWVISGSGGARTLHLAHLTARSVDIHDVEGIGDVLSYAQELRALCRYAHLIGLPGDDDWSLALATSVSRLPRHTLERMVRTIAPLTATQRRTIRVCGARASLAAAAEALYIHRNTLVQRLDRIRQLSGYDLRIPDQLAAARLSMVAAEALGE